MSPHIIKCKNSLKIPKGNQKLKIEERQTK